MGKHAESYFLKDYLKIFKNRFLHTYTGVEYIYLESGMHSYALKMRYSNSLHGKITRQKFSANLEEKNLLSKNISSSAEIEPSTFAIKKI